MSTRTVKVAGFETKSGGEDTERPWTRYTLIDENGKKQSTFDKKVGMLVSSSVGKSLEIEVEQDGKGYWNLLSARPADAPAVSNGKSNGGYDAATIQRFDERDKRIVREAALHAVTRLHEGTGADFGSILYLAEQAVRWIHGGGVVDPKPVPDVIQQIAAAMADDLPKDLTGPNKARVVTRILDVHYKTIEGKGRRFTVLTSGDETYYTFSETIAQYMKKAKESKAIISVEFHEEDIGHVIDSAQEVSGTIRGAPQTVPS